MKAFFIKIRYVVVAALILLISAAVIGFSIYLTSLDKEIRARFAGARWALPAQVYAAPLELYPGQALDSATLKHELERLGYREQPEPQGPGTFAITKDQALIYTRAFNFWDGAQPESRLSVRLAPAGITEVNDAVSGKSRDIVRLDPMLIGSIYPQQGEDRVLVKLTDVPQMLPRGLVAVEDRSFYSHYGVSIKGIMRAAFANLMAGHAVEGASTITQQLVKNFFLTPERSLKRKFKEVCMALLLEAHYSKDEIMEAYLNEVHLGQDGNRAVHGFGLGAQFYFNKPLSELHPHEFALLVGLVKGPSYYNPRRNPERAKARRDLVLQIFNDEGLIDDAEYKSAVELPLGLAGKSDGVARYPAFVDLVKRQLKGQYQDNDLTNEGLRIFTTLDPRAQEALEKQITEGLPVLEGQRKMKAGALQGAGVITSVDGGEVLALVGGRETRYAGFNRALDSRRSIGSLAKPFVYLTALQQPQQFNLTTILPDDPISLTMPNKDVWEPHNYDRQNHGPQPLYMALAQSYNLPTVALGLRVGATEVRKTMQLAGYSGNVLPVPSIFLGSLDAAPVEVAQMYATLAASGYQSPLSAIREVETKEGQPLSRFPIKVKQTLPEGPVYLATWAMRQVMTLGTGRSAYNVISPSTIVAGKTGTTDEMRDAWFAGFSADRVAVIWVGRDDFRPMGLSGATGALPIWSKVMRDIGVRGLDPLPPADVEEQLTDTATGLKADAGCTGAMLVPYIRGYAPTETAPCASILAPVNSAVDWLKGMLQ
ncbi:penicillin-binding protein 1B [Stenotrophobium rhamnosiphilum]|uniref:Penicillin-binding protein 1B n=1 Tax=Stenotrophobium rhamnosiphilum TaxID=2029166 RepID=A0A2T5MHR3_9GAMM|nr:penicillin-binding protein 1B [Stenotrophobium rhamnosiphilum]PTU32117.1 penicillin-binding protein 1B [Stenotrophobium rhamnosiphilum]